MNLSHYARIGLALGVAALGGLAGESDAQANSTVAGWSGKAFYPADASCFGPNASAAQNNCNDYRYFAIYPTTSDQLTLNNMISVVTSAPDGLNNQCQLFIYHNWSLLYSSGWQLGDTNGVINFGNSNLGYNNAVEIVCSVPPNGKIKYVNFHT